MSCLLVLGTAPYSLAQLSPFSTPSTSSQQVLGWNPNRAYACGRLLCSDVFLPGTIGRSFTLAQNIAPGDPKEELEVAIATPTNLVENIMASIQRTILNRQAVRGVRNRITSHWFNAIALGIAIASSAKSIALRKSLMMRVLP